MREFKFRIWDDVEKKMIYPPADDEKEGWMISLGGDIYTEEWNEEDDCTDLVNCDPGYYKFMQYTGVNDKNGKEIYDGDLITWRMDDNRCVLTEVVSWYEAESAFVLYQDDPLNKDNYMLLGQCNNETIDVVGNIYEGVKNENPV